MSKNQIYTSLGIVAAISMLAVNVGLSATQAYGDDGPTAATAANASVTVSSTCTMTANVTSPHEEEIPNGTFKEDIGSTTLQAFCNDASGFAIYAVGFTGDTVGNNKLTDSTIGTSYDISAGTTLDGTASNWAMKLASVSGTYAPNIINGFNAYTAVPSAYTKVAKFDSTTDNATSGVGSSVTTTYAASIAPAQPAGTYTGQVKYVLVHPSTAAAPDAYSMQDVADWGSQVLLNEEVQVYDERDGKSYIATRLCMDTTNKCSGDSYDSEIWMTQNLDFLPDTSVTYSYADTDIGHTTGNTSATWNPGSTLATPATISSFNSGSTADVVSGWVNSNNTPYVAEGGDTYVYNGTIYTSLSACEQAHTEAQCLHYHVGNYYNWTAAIASNNSSSYTSDPTTAPDSVCPAGWRLPKGLTTDNGDVVMSEFNQLLIANNITTGSDTTLGTTATNVQYTANGFNSMITKPYFFARGGLVFSTSLYNFSTNGYYWSSSAQSSSDAYYLNFGSGGLYPANRGSRGYGRSLRCVAR